jgi:nucleoside-diphosphate-sugar epimerase
MKERVLVTGGAGYLGSLLVPMLLEEGMRVVIFDRFMWGAQPILHFATHPNLDIITGDVRDRAALRAAMNGCDSVVHLAAIVGYPACAADPDLARSTNLAGTRNVIEELDGRRLVFASTGSTYGKVDGICTEETPIAPLTLYGATKAEAEAMVMDTGGVSLRLATVFGVSPRLRLDLLVNDFVYQAVHAKQLVLFESHFRRTFLHCRDAARSFQFALANYDTMKNTPYNVGDEAMNYTKRQVAERINYFWDYYLHDANIGQDPDKRDYEVDYSKIRALGFRASIDLDGGIKELLKLLRHLHVHNPWRNA